MNWWWKKKKEPDPVPAPPVMVRGHVVKYDSQIFDVGAATVLVIFSDGREVHTKIYGYVDQYVYDDAYDRRRGRSPMVYPVSVVSSEQMYKRRLLELNPNEPTKILDDPHNPTVAWTGIITHMEFVSNEKYEVSFNVASLVEADVPQPGPEDLSLPW